MATWRRRRPMVEQTCHYCESHLYYSKKFGNFLCRKCNQIIPLNEEPRYRGIKLKYSDTKTSIHSNEIRQEIQILYYLHTKTRVYSSEVRGNIVQILYYLRRPMRPVEIQKTLSSLTRYHKRDSSSIICGHLKKMVDDGLVKHEHSSEISMYSLLPAGYELAQELIQLPATETLQTEISEKMLPTLRQSPVLAAITNQEELMPLNRNKIG